jgi:hypothetical protein
MNKPSFALVRGVRNFGAPVTALIAFATVLLLGHQSPFVENPDPSPAQVTGTVVAPNLMVVMGNGYSMNREMDDRSYPGLPAVAPMPFVSITNPTVDLSVSYRNHHHAEQPTSKFFLAKQAMTDIVNDDSLSANINIGFATWRTAYAQPVWAAQTNWQYKGYELFLNDHDVINQPTPQRYAYASDPKNFKAVQIDMGPASPNAACPAQGTNSNTNTRMASDRAIVGNGLCDGGQEVIKESAADYMTANGGVGGLPRHVVPNHLAPYWDIWASPFGTGFSQNGYPAPNNYQWLDWSIFYRTDMPPNGAHFCGTWYTSEGNYFGVTYLLDYALPGEAYQYIHDFRNTPYAADNTKDGTGGKRSCSSTEVDYGELTRLMGKEVRRADGTTTTIYETFIPSFYTWLGAISESAPAGSLSGWSGEAVLLDGGTPSETIVVTYPAGPAATENPSAPGRQLLSKGLITNGVTHMGTFLDLPDPALGYVDQRETIRGFMLPTQMDGSGLEYDPVTQTIAANALGKSTKGIRTSDAGGDGQSPVYDSLYGALGYYSAYKKVDPNDACRSNHVLLIYDGRENSRYYYDSTVPGNIRWADPADMSKRLFDELGVSTHVIIISAVRGDIEEANRIASNGGTTKAYVIGDYTQLQAALRSVFVDLQAKIVRNPPAVPVYVRAGDAAYTSVNYASPFYGTLEARSIMASGSVSATPLWDTNERMTTSIRSSKLYASDGSGLSLFTSLPDPLFAVPTGSSLTPDIIKNFTIDPSYNLGIYLNGRKDGALQGRMSSTQPITVEQIASPDLALIPGYLGFARGLSDKHKSVLFSSDDGFLYAVGQEGTADAGTLLWGWMPASFIPRLKNVASFPSQKAMDGDLRVIDLPAGGGFERMILGVADKGRLHYALALKVNGELDRIVFEDAHPGTGSDASTAPRVLRTASATFAIYLRGTELRRVDLNTGASSSVDISAISASGVLSSLHVHGTSAFVGTGEGRIFEFTATDMVLRGEVGTLGVTAGTPPRDQVTAISSAVIDNSLHVIAHSTTRMTAFSRPSLSPPGSAFDRNWSVYNGGAEGAGVSPLPASGRFSDRLAIVEGVVFASVTVDGAALKGSCLKGSAELHFFDLASGKFPLGAVVNKETDEVLTKNVVIGSGEALGVTLTQFEGGQLGVYASAQAAGGATGASGSVPFTVRAPVARVVWWKEIDRDNY